MVGTLRQRRFTVTGWITGSASYRARRSYSWRIGLSRGNWSTHLLGHSGMSMLVLVKEGLEVLMVELEDVSVFGGIGRVRSRRFMK